MELAWNTQKNQMNDVKGKEMEQERKGKISNEDIDLDKTENNYDLVEDERTLHQRVKNRVDELKESGSRVQKNSVVMYSNILTVPEEQAKVWGEEKTDDYFKTCYDFFSKEFGAENVVSAKVHKDETTPHMHLHFVPVNKENGKLQARVSMNKAKINYIHDELPKFLQERGFDVVRGKGKTEKNIENIHEYKKTKELEKEIKEIAEEVEYVTKPKTKIAEIDKTISKSIFGKIQLSEEQYKLLKNMALNGVKYRIELKDEIKQTKIENTNLKKENVFWKEKQETLLNKESELDRKQDLVDIGKDWENQKAFLDSQITSKDKKIGILEEKIDKLSQAFDDLKHCFANVAQAVGLLYYDKEKKQDLNKFGQNLVKGIGDYVSGWLRKVEDPELAKEVDEKVGLSNGIKKQMDRQEPQRNNSRDYDMELG